MLSAEERLRSGSAFQQVYDQGRATGDRFVVIHALPRPDRPLERLVGFAVGKKIGNAVIRNLVKRRLREAFRKLSPGVIGGIWLVARAKPAAARATYLELETSLDRLLARANLSGPTESLS